MTQSNEWQRVIRGILLAIFLAVATFAVLVLSTTGIERVIIGSPGMPRWVYTTTRLVAIAGYSAGITQMLYVIPLIIFLRRQQRLALMKGITIGALIVALVNFGCFLFVAQQLSQ